MDGQEKRETNEGKYGAEKNRGTKVEEHFNKKQIEFRGGNVHQLITD